MDPYSCIPGHYLPVLDEAFYREPDTIFEEGETAKNKVGQQKLNELLEKKTPTLVCGDIEFSILNGMLISERKGLDVHGLHCGKTACRNAPCPSSLFCEPHLPIEDDDMDISNFLELETEDPQSPAEASTHAKVLSTPSNNDSPKKGQQTDLSPHAYRNLNVSDKSVEESSTNVNLRLSQNATESKDSSDYQGFQQKNPQDEIREKTISKLESSDHTQSSSKENAPPVKKKKSNSRAESLKLLRGIPVFQNLIKK